MQSLTREQLEILATQLDNEERRVLAQAGVGRSPLAVPVSREPGDMGDQAKEESEERLGDAILEHFRLELTDITAARRRMAQGSYGVCTDCGEPVPFERLVAYPIARRCTNCQRQFEQMHRRA